MVVELTQQRKHVKVATTSKEKPVVIPLDDMRESPSQPLEGKVFVISGNIIERGEKKNKNTEDVTKLILDNGGNVYSGDMEKAVDADYILITSQKEVDKEHLKLNKAIALAYQYGWPIISKRYVIDADGKEEPPVMDNYKLDLTKISEAPEGALAKVSAVKKNSVVDVTKRYSAHREMKRKIRQTDRKRTEERQKKTALKQPPKRACSGYTEYHKDVFATIKKEGPTKTLKEINQIISSKWKGLSADAKDRYSLRGKENFQKHKEQCS